MKTRAVRRRTSGRGRGLQPPTAHGVVPFVARWSGERDGAMPVVVRRDGRGIGYADERAYDRDGRGVLWSRTPSQPGRGRPELGRVHSLRQRVAMTGLRCQICGGAADRTDAGVLWLLDVRSGELIIGGERTAHPPVCRPCAHRSVRACPHLRSAFTAVRVRSFVVTGVKGVLYAATRSAPAPVDVGVYAFDDLRLPWVRGHQLLVTLTDFTVIDLSDPVSESQLPDHSDVETSS